MKLYEIAGYAAMVLMVISPVPQLYETWKKKTVEGLSFGMLMTLFLGCVLMGYYVLMTTMDAPLLLNYGFSILVVGINIFFFFKYKK